MNDFYFMNIAYRQALKGKTTVSPNPMVGAVIVKNGKVVSQGFHHHRGGPHAEIVAMKKVKGRLDGATLYVTLEPCFHFGLTPPCVDAILASGIKEVVVGMIDPNPLTAGKSIAKLRKAGIKVRVGVLQEQLTVLNQSFIKYITKKMPFVVAKTAQTLDGKIATAVGQSKWITSETSRKFAHDYRNEFDAILVGINTVLKDDPALNAPSKALKKVVVDSVLRMPLKAKLFKNTLPQNCFIATTKKAGKAKIAALEKRGVEVVICPDKNSQVDLGWLMRELARRKIAKVLIEGGAKVIGSALKAKLVDKMIFFVAPKIVGDQNAQSSVEGLNVLKISKAVGLKNLEFRKIGEDILFEADVQ